MASRIAELLRGVDIFQNVSESDLESIAALVKEQHYGEGQLLFKQGDPGESLAIVAEGRVKAYLGEGRQENVLAFFEPGQSIGEMALLTGEPRPTSAAAVSNTLAALLAKEDFDRYLLDNVVVMREMMRVIAGRQSGGARPAGGGPATTGLAIGGAAAAKEGKVITVFGPRGGSGKTMLAVNLAVSLAQAHRDEVALLDLSATFGHCALMLNVAPRASLASCPVENVAHLETEGTGHYTVTHAASSLKLMVGANRAEEADLLSGEHVREAIGVLRRLNNYVVVDTGSNFGEPTIAALEMSNRIPIICLPDLATLRDVRECQRIFWQVLHLSSDDIHYVMNNVFSFKPLAVDQFVQTLEQEMHTEIPFGNDVPSKAVVRGEAFVLTQPNSNVAKAIDRMAKTLDAELYPDQRQQERRGLFGR